MADWKRKLVGKLFGTQFYVMQMSDGNWGVQSQSGENPTQWGWEVGIEGRMLFWPTEEEAVKTAQRWIREGRAPVPNPAWGRAAGLYEVYEHLSWTKDRRYYVRAAEDGTYAEVPREEVEAWLLSLRP